MRSRLNPYISFKGNAREAMEFYKTVFGGTLILNTFQESGMVHGDNGQQIMHGMLEAENGVVLMASDTPPDMPYDEGARISISLSGDNEAELRGYWDKLAQGASITVPMDKAPWGDIFGMLTDKFDVHWMVNVTAPTK